jgi:diguanylate cyclase (GGDEF)-like protein
MNDKRKTKSQLIRELVELRQQASELETLKMECDRAKTEAESAFIYTNCILDTLREPLVLLNRDQKIISANRSFYNVFKVTPGETVGKPIYKLGNNQWNIPILRTLLNDIVVKNIQFDDFEVDFDFPIIGRKIMMLNARGFIQNDIDSQRILLVIEDITKRKQLEEKLISMAFVDDLTGLYNRRGLFTLSDKLLKMFKREKKGFFMLYVDTDNLKIINDTKGHEVGNKALIDSADILREQFRESDIIARVGGDEFVVLPIVAAGETAQTIISRLQKAVESHNCVNDRSYRLSLSGGIAYFDPETNSSLEKLLDQADESMFKQKNHKKSHYSEST